jgi:hypothetical protein
MLYLVGITVFKHPPSFLLFFPRYPTGTHQVSSQKLKFFCEQVIMLGKALGSGLLPDLGLHLALPHMIPYSNKILPYTSSLRS